MLELSGNTLMDLHAVTEFLQSAATLAAIGRLVYLDVAKRFPALVAYLVLLALTNFLYGILNTRSALYFWVYMGLVPLDCLLSVIAVRELFALVFDRYRGIRTMGRWAMYAGTALALAISVALTKASWSGAAVGRSHSHLFYWEVSQRSVVFTLSVVIATLVYVLSKYPLHLSRNTWVSSAFFSALFLSEAVRLLIDSLAPKLYNRYIDWSESIFIAACLGTWAALLQPETVPVAQPVIVSTDREDELLHQLDSLNQLMGRVARR
jgi:hypothetical protein